jgi:small subunit ribosomal protein S12
LVRDFFYPGFAYNFRKFSSKFSLVLSLSTISQLKQRLTLKKKNHKKTPGLLGCPQVRGTVVRFRILTPRKPNSARRPTIKVKLVNKKRITAHVPGKENTMRKHASVLIRGGGARDLPGVNYTSCRGVYDLSGVPNKRRRRSIYGVKRPLSTTTKVRRKIRNR